MLSYHLRTLVLCLGSCLLLSQPWAESLDLTLPSLSNGRHRYYGELLEAALRDAGHTVRIRYSSELPQVRVWWALEQREISLVWGVQTDEREARYLGAGQNLTNGLIGQRVLLARPAIADGLAAVRTVDDLRKTGLIAGFGEAWFENDVWQYNKLPKLTQKGNWTWLFAKSAHGGRGVDYLPRSVLEVGPEMAAYGKGLVIVPGMMLVYNRDMRFYLLPDQAKLASTIDAAMRKAERSGLLQRQARSYFGPQLSKLDLEKRQRVVLSTPPLGVGSVR